jgi:polyphosphate kinase
MSEESTSTPEVIQELDLNTPELYINRELSLLDFQARVLAEAQDENYPILERVKFLAYVFQNLDEFFMVRVGGLQMQDRAGVTKLSKDGLTPAEQLALVRKKASKLFAEAQACWLDEIKPALDENGIHILQYEELAKKQHESVTEYFHESIFPTLTPLAFDPGHPFPHISNLSLNLAIFIESEKGEQHFARVKVPSSFPRFLPIKRSSGSVRKDGTVPHHHYFVLLEQVIANNLEPLFPGMKVLETHPFRIIRNNDMIIQEIEAGDLLETMEESVRKRRFGQVVQLAVEQNISEEALGVLTANLRVGKNDVFTYNGELGLSHLMDLSKINRFDLKEKQYTPYVPPKLRIEANGDDIFSVIRQGDLLIRHPYDSFDPVVKFIETAASDPRVLAIKQTLYRAGQNSPIVKQLLTARRDHDKQVAVMVELKARFDEKSNITWARRLEEEGVHVTYGLVGLKTHAKMALVVRHDEDDVIRRYVHLGTGNYNHITANAYEDFGLFTCNSEIGADATDLFNLLTGYSAKSEFRKLYVAPINLRAEFSELILNEIENQKNGEKGQIIFKMNSLVDPKMIKLLYQASQAGVEVYLIVRGICCLKPGIPGVSENIKVISVLGKYLEHSRIYYFRNGGKEKILMGSADLMPRNLNNRVETLFPISDQKMIRNIRDNMLKPYLREDLRGWTLDPDGTYQRNGVDPENIFCIQKWLRKEAAKMHV